MFDRQRSDLVRRLKLLMQRFEQVIAAAEKLNQKAALALKMGLPAELTMMQTSEVMQKAEEQRGLCAQAVSLLLVDRALPLMFARSVRKAERFADSCEDVLETIEDAAGGQGGVPRSYGSVRLMATLYETDDWWPAARGAD